MKYQERQIEIDDHTVSYIDEGEAEGPVLVFIHGFPFDKWTWEKQIDVLKESFRVVAYDVRGHGKSTADTSSASVDQYARDLFQFLDVLEIDSVILCGLSMGGYIALNAAVSQPGKMKALILCDTQCGADSEEARKKRMDLIGFIQEEGLAQYASESLQKLFCEASLKHKAKEVSIIQETILKTPVVTIVHTLLALAHREETCSKLNQLSIPVMILVGESDQITPLDAAKKMHALIKGATIHIIENAAHLSNVENAPAFNSLVQRFINTIVPVGKLL